MKGWEPTSGDSWGGRPVARRVTDARARQRGVVTGKVVDTERCIWRGAKAQVFTIDDGTGQVAVVFRGVRSVPGMVEGVHCTVEGTAPCRRAGGSRCGTSFYRFEP